MTLLYITADVIGTPTGGGRVTYEEREALKGLGDVITVQPRCDASDPFAQDADVLEQLGRRGQVWFENDSFPKLAHFYAGCFSRTCDYLKSVGCKISYTTAAHSVEASRKAHEDLGLGFPYPHLTDPWLFKEYIRGYIEADLCVVPSHHSQNVVVLQGRRPHDPPVIIPHGCDLPPEERLCPAPRGFFTVGYLGAIGPDKGLSTLLKAWARLAKNPGDLLVLAGRDSTHPWISGAIKEFGAAPVYQAGWQKDTTDFYNGLSVYVQPSNTEGFGIEVLEAMAHDRPVLCSTGAGAHQHVPEWYRFAPGDYHALAGKLEELRNRRMHTQDIGQPPWRHAAAEHTWDKVRQRYQDAWRRLLS